MGRIEKNIEIVHDLLLIQSERALAYEKILRWADHDEQVLKFLKKMAVHSRNAILELRKHTDVAHGDPADRVEIRGEIYYTWPGIKQFLPGSTISDIITASEYNETATKYAYEKALANDDKLCPELKNIISEHLGIISDSFNFIYQYKEKPTAPETVNEEGSPFVFLGNRVFEGV